MPGLALYGFQGEEADLEEIELVASEEESDAEGEEGGPGPPQNVFSLCLFLLSFLVLF